MKSLLSAILTGLFVLTVQTASAASGEPQAQPGSKTEPSKAGAHTVVPIPKSVFEISTQFKDPFHPRSTRREKTEPGNKNDAPPPDVKPAEFLVLNGLSGPANNRLAIINGKTLAPGESAEVTTERGKVRIRCLEVRETSVLVAVGADGTTTELKWKD